METKRKKPVGIDLGTTYSEIATVTESGTVIIIPDSNGDRKFPTLTSYAGSQIQYARYAGPDLITSPEKVARYAKRYIGKVTDAGNPIPMLTASGGESITPVDAACDFLGYCKSCAESQFGELVEQAVITVPAYFEEVARNHTKQAALAAGFKEVVLQDEPVAAALYYGLEKGRDEIIVVVDFGGGTLDLTCIEVKGTEIKAILITGDSHLGGTNYDEALLEWMIKEAGKEGIHISPDDPATMNLNLDRAREGKEMLARREEVNVIAEANGKRARLNLNRKKFRKICKEFDDRFILCCQEMQSLLTEKNIQPDRILLVGGSGRSFHVPEMVQPVFGIEPSRDADPDFVVCKGAAIWAQKMFGDKDQAIAIGGNRYLADQIQMHTVAAHAICVASIDLSQGTQERNYPIVPANVTLPHTFEERFAPLDPRQTQINIKIMQGKPGELSSQSTLLREIQVSIQACEENKDRIKVVGNYTDEGLLELTVVDELLGKPISDSFTYAAGLQQATV